MDRRDSILRFADLSAPGIEIAPYISPLIPKRNHNNVFTLDVFSTTELLKRAENDPNVKNLSDNIEEVDFVGDACQIEQLVSKHEYFGDFQYIVSSHNFEHLPNPIKFLAGCEKALQPGGVLSMAIPDYRACFDHFRFPTRLSDWLFAYHNNIFQPDPETIFDFASNSSRYIVNGRPQVGCDISTDDPLGFRLTGDIRQQYKNYLIKKQQGNIDYEDAHCSAVSNLTFELLVGDLIRIGLIEFEILDISTVRGLEFYAHLRKPVQRDRKVVEREETSNTDRENLLRRISNTLGESGFSLKSSDKGRRAMSAVDDRLSYIFHNPWKNLARYIDYTAHKSASKFGILPRSMRENLEKAAEKRLKNWLSL